MAARAGIEYKLKKNYALYHEVGTYFPNANGMSNNKGIIVRCELKRYLNREGLTSGHYLSAELFYKYQYYGTSDSIHGVPDYSRNYFVSKNVGCLSLKYGFMLVCKHRIILEGFAGIGVRYKVAHSSLTTDENDNLMSSDDSYNINLALNKAGTSVTPNVNVGVKIGYRLK